MNLGGWSGQYRNVGDEDAHGWDLQIAKRFDSHVSARLGYTNTHVDAIGARKANVDGYLPTHQWNIGVDYKNRRFDASLMARAMIDRPGPVNNAFPETSYWVCDLGMNYKIMETTKVYLKINNIFDKFYAEHSNVKYGGAGQWWTAPGRSFVVGVEHSF